MLTLAVAATLAAIAMPVMTDITGTIKMNEAARIVERELQDARLKAVSSNRIVRVRLNCPATGELRRVEFLNTAADSASNRCAQADYPFPPADNDVLTRPNYDGPIRLLPAPATMSSVVIQFHPDGTARNVVANVAQTIAVPVTITVSRYSLSRTITVNGAGKVRLQ